MMLSSVAHALLGWPAMRGELQKVGAGSDLMRGLGAGWYFGSVAMLTFGVVTLICGLRFKRGDFSGAVPAQVIGAGYVLFGLAAFLSLNECAGRTGTHTFPAQNAFTRVDSWRLRIFR